jgi:glucosamine--fructose-6-phosphate aminotransferase (isomerizing)
MCGVVGILGRRRVAARLLEALKRLEYRGYDSAGVATVADGALHRRRAEGKLDRLAALIEDEPIPGQVGIGHTRWATHGVPSTRNAHPIAVGGVAVVHNGIIENFKELRAEATAFGARFDSDTDTEVVAHLLDHRLAAGDDPEAAMRAVLPRLQGAFAFAVLFRDHPGVIAGARLGSPLAFGWGEGEMFLGSDALALAPLTDRVSYLDEGDMVLLTADGARVFDRGHRLVDRPAVRTELGAALVGKGNHRHFMEKEIHEQPQVVAESIGAFLPASTRRLALPDLGFDLAGVQRLNLVACGTSHYAGMVAKYWIEDLARLPVTTDIASEFRYRRPPLAASDLSVFVSQSGETVDTLWALRHAKGEAGQVAALVNVPGSSIAREAGHALRTLAGIEIGVASTKCFTAQLAVFACLAVALGAARGTLASVHEAELTRALIGLPARMGEVLARRAIDRAIVERLTAARVVLYLGRGTSYPLALEGALKLKELSYIHAEGHAAGEMKHGPIALIEDGVPVIVVAPSDRWFEKTLGNVQEIAARRGVPIVVTDAAGTARLEGLAAHVIEMPAVDPFVAPLLYSLPIQLLAYDVAVAKGTDVDQPRNLAKSVVVE